MRFTGENRTSASENGECQLPNCLNVRIYLLGDKYSLGNHVGLWREANMVLIQILLRRL